MIRLLAPVPSDTFDREAVAAQYPTALDFNIVEDEDGYQLAVYFEDDDPAAASEEEWRETVDQADDTPVDDAIDLIEDVT